MTATISGINLAIQQLIWNSVVVELMDWLYDRF